MLFIRPIIRANTARKYKVHTIVFFIFLVANVGGSLSPLGDPPLFLGFLKGVSFFWPTTNLLAPTLVLAGLLLLMYYLLERFYYAREDKAALHEVHADEPENFGLEGKINLLLILGVIAAVLASGLFQSKSGFEVYHVKVLWSNLARDLTLVGLALLSLRLTENKSRRLNDFTWFPIVEVAKLFAGIFITIIPAIAILKAGTHGALGFVVDLVNTEAGPNNVMYFWATGLLSAFLDNAPTYLVFFNTAGGDATELMGSLSRTLFAISTGAVYMGAVSYIGNAPNFMVRSIAEQSGIAMPSFFGYMVWSLIFLFPGFFLLTFLFL